MNREFVQVHIKGTVGAEQLSPANFDIAELKELLENVSAFFEAGGKQRPTVSLDIENGSFVGKFVSTVQSVAMVGALITLVQADNSLRGLNSHVAKAFANIQKVAIQKNYSFSLSTSLNKEQGEPLMITPKTSFHKYDPIWVSGEFYFYGTIVDAGGKTNPNIHLDVKNLGVITISSAKEYLAKQDRNLLYHECGVRVKGVQNAETGELGSDFELIEIMDYTQNYDENYLEDCIQRASKHLKGLEVDKFLKELRGNNEYA